MDDHPDVDVNPRSRPTSHHRRRSSVSTRRESAEMMGVPLPPEDENQLAAKISDNRRLALWALEGSVVEIPDWKSPDTDSPREQTFSKPFPTSHALAGKRDSFGKLLLSSSSTKLELHTLHEEEEEEDDTRPRQNLRPLSLQPAPRVALKSLTLNTTPTAAPYPRSLILTSGSSPEPKPNPVSASPAPPQRRPTIITYRRSSAGPQSSTTPSVSSPVTATPQSAFSDYSEPLTCDEPGPLPQTVSPTLPCPSAPSFSQAAASPTEASFLYQSQVALLARISELEAALAARSTTPLQSSRSSSPKPPPTNLDEFLALIGELKSERDDLTRQVHSWKSRCTDLEGQVALLVRRVESERNEAWHYKERVGILTTEKESLQNEVDSLTGQCDTLRHLLEKTDSQGADKGITDVVDIALVAGDGADSLQTPTSGDWPRETHEQDRMARFSFGGNKPAVASPSVTTPPTPASDRQFKVLSMWSESSTDVDAEDPEGPGSQSPAKEFGFSASGRGGFKDKLVALSEDDDEEEEEEEMMPPLPGDLMLDQTFEGADMDDVELGDDAMEDEEAEEEDELAHYEDEDSDISFGDEVICSSGSSSTSIELVLPAPGSRSRTPIETDVPTPQQRQSPQNAINEPLSPEPSSPETPIRPRRSSLSKAWSFPATSSTSAVQNREQRPAEVDRFFNCLESLDQDAGAELSWDSVKQSTLRFGRNSSQFGEAEDEDEDDMPPFLLPAQDDSANEEVAQEDEEGDVTLRPGEIHPDQEENQFEHGEDQDSFERTEQNRESHPYIDISSPCSDRGRSPIGPAGVPVPRLVLTRSSVASAGFGSVEVDCQDEDSDSDDDSREDPFGHHSEPSLEEEANIGHVVDVASVSPATGFTVRPTSPSSMTSASTVPAPPSPSSSQPVSPSPLRFRFPSFGPNSHKNTPPSTVVSPPKQETGFVRSKWPFSNSRKAAPALEKAEVTELSPVDIAWSSPAVEDDVIRRSSSSVYSGDGYDGIERQLEDVEVEGDNKDCEPSFPVAEAPMSLPPLRFSGIDFGKYVGASFGSPPSSPSEPTPTSSTTSTTNVIALPTPPKSQVKSEEPSENKHGRRKSLRLRLSISRPRSSTWSGGSDSQPQTPNAVATPTTATSTKFSLHSAIANFMPWSPKTPSTPGSSKTFSGPSSSIVTPITPNYTQTSIVVIDDSEEGDTPRSSLGSANKSSGRSSSLVRSGVGRGRPPVEVHPSKKNGGGAPANPRGRRESRGLGIQWGSSGGIRVKKLAVAEAVPPLPILNCDACGLSGIPIRSISPSPSSSSRKAAICDRCGRCTADVVAA